MAKHSSPQKLLKEVYIEGLSKNEDQVVIKDYTFVWDDNECLKKLIINYRHFQDADALQSFFTKENEMIRSSPGIQLPTVRKMIVQRGWAVASAKEAFFRGFGVYNLLTCVTGKTGPMLRRQNTDEVTRKRKLHDRGRRMAYDPTANCSNFVVIPGQEESSPADQGPVYDGDFYAVFDLFTLDDRVPLSINRPVGQRMMTLDSSGSGGSKKNTNPREVKEKLPMTFAEELMAKAPSVRDILRQTKSFWIPYSQSGDTLPRTLIFFTTDLERSWQIFDVSTDDEAPNFMGIQNRQDAFDFVSGQMLFRFFNDDLASKWAEVIAACSEHVMSLKGSIMTETSTELAKKIWEGEVFWKYLDQTIDKQIEVLQMFCSELKASQARNVPILNLENEDMEWIKTQLSKLKRLIGQNIIEPSNTNMQMLFTIASLQEAQTANEYGASMTWLSWVTCTFLPLSFLTSVLGMNDTKPAVKWYFIGVMLMAGVILLAWRLARRLNPKKNRRTNYQSYGP